MNVFEIVNLSGLIVASAVPVLSGVYFITKYLQKNETHVTINTAKEITDRVKLNAVGSRDARDKLIEDVKFLQLKVESLQGSDTAKLAEAVKNDVLRISAEDVLSEIEEKISRASTAQAAIEAVDSQHSTTIRRFEQELYSLAKRGNLNLSIGIVITVSALIMLGYFVIGEIDASEPTGMMQFANNYLPRLSLVVLIEIFAFFFCHCINQIYPRSNISRTR